MEKNEKPYILNVVCIYMEGNNLKKQGRTYTQIEKGCKESQRRSKIYEKKKEFKKVAAKNLNSLSTLCSHLEKKARKTALLKKSICKE